MRVRAVPQEQLGERSREDWVDQTRRPYAEEGVAWVPVREGFPFEREIPERALYRGRGFFMLGDIAVVHSIRPSPAEVEEIVRLRRPRGVLWIEALRNITRTPETEVLWGEVSETLHRENGYEFLLDPRVVMFSQGNLPEKRRMAELVRAGGKRERVADMFAGIGYFSIPMAASGADVHAMEINSASYRYLEENTRRNNLAGRITPACGDCRTLLSGVYDRILMGHFAAFEALPQALAHSRRGTVLHVHSIGPAEGVIRTIVEGAGFSATIGVHNVKKYRPHTWHVVQDVTLS